MDQDLDENGTATAEEEQELAQAQGEAESDQPGEIEQLPDQAAGEADQDEGVIVTIGDDAPSQEEEELSRAPQWVRDLRKSNQENKRLLREKDEEIARLKGGEKPVELGEKPTLESCDFDTELFEKRLDEWKERQRAVQAEAEKRKKAQEEVQQAWNASMANYTKLKGELKVSDFDEAEAAAMDMLSPQQQGYIVAASDNPAAMVYAVGKNAKKAKELAAISDPVKFIVAITKLEAQLKITPRKSPPPPESTVRGSAPVSGTVDVSMERLREEARRTGDYSKVAEYRRQQEAKARAKAG